MVHCGKCNSYWFYEGHSPEQCQQARESWLLLLSSQHHSCLQNQQPYHPQHHSSQQLSSLSATVAQPGQPQPLFVHPSAAPPRLSEGSANPVSKGSGPTDALLQSRQHAPLEEAVYQLFRDCGGSPNSSSSPAVSAGTHNLAVSGCSFLPGPKVDDPGGDGCGGAGKRRIRRKDVEESPASNPTKRYRPEECEDGMQFSQVVRYDHSDYGVTELLHSLDSGRPSVPELPACSSGDRKDVKYCPAPAPSSALLPPATTAASNCAGWSTGCGKQVSFDSESFASLGNTNSSFGHSSFS